MNIFIDVILPLIFLIVVFAGLFLIMYFYRRYEVLKYNETHKEKLKYTNQRKSSKRFRDWYLQNFYDKEEK